MADFPTSVFDQRTIENKSGVSYDASKSTIVYAEDVTKLGDEVTALENELGEDGNHKIPRLADSEVITGAWAHQKLAGYLWKYQNVYSTGLAHSTLLAFRKSHQNTEGYTTTLINETFGSIIAYGVGGDADVFNHAAQILFEQDAAAQLNGVPGRIVLKTTTDAEPGVLAEAMRIDSSQVVDFSVKAIGPSDGAFLEGDTTGGRVLRRIYFKIDNGTNAATLKCTVVAKWNGDAIAETDNIAKDASVGNFSLNAAGTVLTIEAAGLSGNVVMAHGTVRYNGTATDLTIFADASGNDITIALRNSTTGATLDLTTLVDTGSIAINILYLTDA